MSKIEDRVCERLQARAAAGKAKYGTTMERMDLTREEWLRHAQEEALDLAVYLEKLLEERRALVRVQNIRDPRPYPAEKGGVL